MTKQADVTVIIPNYNCLTYLPECLRSIRAQKEVPFQIIVVDDGSTDGSLEWLEKEEKASDDLRLLRESRLGPGGARNIAAQVAETPFLAFLDADDLWEENKLESQIAFHKANPGVVLSFTDYIHIAEKDRSEIIGCFEYWPLFSALTKNHASLYGYSIIDSPSAHIFNENIIGTSTTVVRRDAFLAIGGFDTDLNSASDWDVWLKLAKVGDVAFTGEKTMRYLMRQGSVSSNMEKRMQAMQTIVDRHKEAALRQDENALKYVKARMASGYRDIYFHNNQKLKALLYSVRAFASLPSKRYFKSMVADVLTVFSPALKN